MCDLGEAMGCLEEPTQGVQTEVAGHPAFRLAQRADSLGEGFVAFADALVETATVVVAEAEVWLRPIG